VSSNGKQFFWYTAEVEDITTSPPQQDTYTKLRTDLLNQPSPSRLQCVHQFFTFGKMGDSKPSQFLRHLKEPHTDYFLCSI
jgi:hypothetical protein